MEKMYLNVVEAADFLRFSKSTIYAYVYYRRIPYIKVEGKLVFDKESLVKWMKSKEKKEVLRNTK